MSDWGERPPGDRPSRHGRRPAWDAEDDLPGRAPRRQLDDSFVWRNDDPADPANAPAPDPYSSGSSTSYGHTQGGGAHAASYVPPAEPQAYDPYASQTGGQAYDPYASQTGGQAYDPYPPQTGGQAYDPYPPQTGGQAYDPYAPSYPPADPYAYEPPPAPPWQSEPPPAYSPPPQDPYIAPARREEPPSQHWPEPPQDRYDSPSFGSSRALQSWEEVRGGAQARSLPADRLARGPSPSERSGRPAAYDPGPPDDDEPAWVRRRPAPAPRALPAGPSSRSRQRADRDEAAGARTTLARRDAARPATRAGTNRPSRGVPRNAAAAAAPGASPRKLQVRVVMAVTAIIAAGASLLTIDSARALSSASSASDEKELVAIAQTFTTVLAGLGELDPNDVQARADELKSVNSLDLVEVYSIDSDAGEVVILANSDGDNIGRVLNDELDEAGVLLGGVGEYSEAACNGSETCGTAVASGPVPGPRAGVAITRSLEASQQDLARRQRRAAVGVLFLSGLVAVVLAWLLRQLIFAPLRHLQFTMRSLLAGRTERRVDWSRDDEIGVLAMEIDAMADRIQESADSVRDRALEDELTGLPNRRAGMNQLAAEIANGSRVGAPVAVVVFDVDRLREINERYGQEAGDETLRKLADAARLSLRPSDVCARLDEDKFLLILRGADARAAHVALDRLREVMTRIRVGPSGGARISFGVVESWADTDPEELLRRAEDEWARQKDRTSGRSRAY